MNRNNDDRTREFVRLLADCDRQLYSYILTLVGSFADADDIAQDTKVRLWEQFDDYDPSKEFIAWACSVAHYRVMTFRRTKQRDQLRFSVEFIERVSEDVERHSDLLARQQDALATCMESQTPKARLMLKLIYVESFRMKEVASKTGQSLDAAYQAVWRVRKSLLECIRRQLGGSSR